MVAVSPLPPILDEARGDVEGQHRVPLEALDNRAASFQSCFRYARCWGTMMQ
jgi:hypothetical protein